MKPALVVALTAAVLAGLAGCDRSPGLPTTAPSATAPAPPTVTAVVVTGKTSLASVGETTQLCATASYSDGTTRGITGEAAWASSDPSALSVSPQGLVTVLRFGLVYVSAKYETEVGGQAVEAIPAGSLVVAGPSHIPARVFATSTAYTCVAPCMLDRNTIHF
jgi:hypothetical protein